MVKTIVTIKGKTRSCQLPVMDNKNNAVKSPDARKISDAIMRCMTKAISMHGLGLYIYAGEDLPEQIETPEQEAERQKREARGAELDQLADCLIEYHLAGQDLKAIKLWYADETWSKDASDRNEEVTYVWGHLREHSKLRAAIKANKPEPVDA